MESDAKRRRIHIHHAKCGHGGERWVEKWPIDGFHHLSQTIFQFHGCFFHGCPRCYPDREAVLAHGVTAAELFAKTRERTTWLRRAGYKVVEAWACEAGRLEKPLLPQERTELYPHVIFFNIETFGDTNWRKEPTNTLVLENVHVPISVSIGDKREPEPTYICDRNPENLCRRLFAELERRAEAIRFIARTRYMPIDTEYFPKKQRTKIEDWCNQVPVLGFNSGKYDLNVLREYSVEKIAEKESTIRVAKHANKIMFLVSRGMSSIISGQEKVTMSG